MKPYTPDSSQLNFQMLLRNLDCDGTQLHAPLLLRTAHELLIISVVSKLLCGLEIFIKHNDQANIFPILHS